jgi:hypothetical protein
MDCYEGSISTAHETRAAYVQAWGLWSFVRAVQLSYASWVFAARLETPCEMTLDLTAGSSTSLPGFLRQLNEPIRLTSRQRNALT